MTLEAERDERDKPDGRRRMDFEATSRYRQDVEVAAGEDGLIAGTDTKRRESVNSVLVPGTFNLYRRPLHANASFDSFQVSTHELGLTAFRDFKTP